MTVRVVTTKSGRARLTLSRALDWSAARAEASRLKADTGQRWGTESTGSGRYKVVAMAAR